MKLHIVMVEPEIRVYRKNCVKFKNKPSYDKIKKS